MVKAAARRVFLEVLGWSLVVIGVVGLILPGPGLIIIFIGLLALSQQYAWAERRMHGMKVRVRHAAAESVSTRKRTLMSYLVGVLLIALGVLWIQNPPTPNWWPMSDALWLPGSWATGVTQILSGLIAIGVTAYSHYHFHPDRLRTQEPDSTDTP